MNNMQFYIAIIIPTLATLVGNAGIILAVSITNKRVSELSAKIDTIDARLVAIENRRVIV